MYKFDFAEQHRKVYSTCPCDQCGINGVICDHSLPQCGSCTVFARNCAYPPDSKETSKPTKTPVAQPMTSKSFFSGMSAKMCQSGMSTTCFRNRPPVAKTTPLADEHETSPAPWPEHQFAKQPRHSKPTDTDALRVQPYVNVFRRDKRESDDDSQDPVDAPPTPPDNKKLLTTVEGIPKEKNMGHKAEAPEHHPQPWRVVTPIEYKAMQTNDASWQVTTSNDFTLWIPEGSTDSTPMIIQKTKLRGRPPRIKRPRPAEPYENNVVEITPLAPVIKVEPPQPVSPPATPRQPSPEQPHVGVVPRFQTHLYTESGDSIVVDIANVDDTGSLLTFLHSSLDSGDLQVEPNVGEGEDASNSQDGLRIVDGKSLAQHMYSFKGNIYESYIGEQPQSVLSTLGMSTSLTLEYTLLNISNVVIHHYLRCGNITNPILPRQLGMSCFMKLLNPLDHPLVMALTAAWLGHTFCSHEEFSEYTTADKSQPLVDYFTQRALSLFEETFDNLSYTSLCCIGALMFIQPAKHRTYHMLAGRILHVMNIYPSDPATAASEVVVASPYKESVIELRTRMWWYWYLKDECCKVLPSVNSHIFEHLVLPTPIPLETEDDVAGVRFFRAMCSLCHIEREISRTMSIFTDGDSMPEEQITRLEAMLMRWHDELSPEFQRDISLPFNSIWSFYLAIETNIYYHRSLITIHKYAIRNLQAIPVDDDARFLSKRSASSSPTLTSYSFISTSSPPPQSHRSLGQCVRSASAIISYLQTAQTHGYCRPNIQNYVLSCDSLLEVVAASGVPGDHEHVQIARRSLSKALYLLQTSRAHAFGIPAFVSYASRLGESMSQQGVVQPDI
ncbi:hypothetical protein BC936DRAFT_145404 [Jimgerdemannia flammicorona]|uniref:Transcription factor domain-containing protein n=1 Tax=Jimgerdemannia flammicorona TaxID=994334 RepID=A0A433DA31_9FUNG|nr:hypothetical protein BC936DRAFT_145404 [Jimgerdemannia flammicorona]